MVHQNWLICIQQSTDSMKMLGTLTSRWYLAECCATIYIRNVSNSISMVTGRWIQNYFPNNASQWHSLHQIIFWNLWDVLVVVKSLARWMYVVATVQKIPAKATVTPDRTIAWSNDWLRLGERATDRQCLLRSPEAIAYCDRSFLLEVGHRTIGRTRGRAINNDWRRSYD